LTWLWFSAEDFGQVNLEDGTPVGIKLGESLSLAPVMGQEGSRVQVRGREVALAEARQALRRGKLVDGLHLGLMIEGEEFWAALDAATLTPKGLRLPPIAPAAGERNALDALHLERLALILGFLRALDGLFARFLEERCATPPTEGVIARMHAWAGQGCAVD
jgi:hypothetical protein